jgi:DNA helicase-2/ATP-dependent DNA helicase PcrA
MSEETFLGDMHEFLDDKAREQDDLAPVTVIRPATNAMSGAAAALEIFYRKLSELGMNLDELRPILETPGSQQIVAGAGSGKTTLMSLKLVKGLITGEYMKVVSVDSVYGATKVVMPSNILVTTFLKSGAEELAESFFSWLRKLNITGVDHQNIKFYTMHKEVKEALASMGINVVFTEDSTTMIRNTMNRFGIKGQQSTSRGVTMEEINDMASIIGYARNRLDAKRYEHQLMQEYGLDSLMLDAILHDLKIQRIARNEVDFEDIQEMLLEGLRTNENVRRVIANRYDVIFADEFQDTSQLQYEIYKYYFAGAKQKTIIGDDDQTIYTWRGSDGNLLTTQFRLDFPVTVNTLTTNYRCAANILNVVIPSITKNQNRYPKDLKAAKEGGQVNLVYDGDINHLVDSIKGDLSNNMTVGLIARINADLLIPAMIMELDGGIEFGISKSVNMHSRIPKQILGTMDLIMKRFTEDFESHFKLFLPRYQWYEAEKLASVIMVNRDVNIYDLPIEDLTKSVPNLAPFLKGLREAKKMGSVEAYIYILGCLERNTYSGKGSYNQKARVMVSFIRKIILEHNAVKELDMDQIYNLFHNVLPERLQRRIKYGKDRFAKFTTVHEAKGKEWDSVYIWNDVVDSFPNKVGNRDLTPEEYEEERRVHYIAVTRAKIKLTFYTKPNEMGDFLRECNLEVAGLQVIDQAPILEMEQVFKVKKPELSQEIQLDTLLRQYIADTTGGYGINDPRVSNIEIVLNTYQFDDLVERLRNTYSYTVSITMDTYQEAMESMFSQLADEIFNKGQY